MQKNNKIKKPWPTQKAMEQVYDMNLWGKSEAAFYSGEGSHLPEIVEPYIKVVNLFLSSFEKPLTVCDLGCGDFNIGQQLFAQTKQYIAVDIVPKLIAYNQEKFQHENLSFHCLDIAKDELPNADCAIIRQVLQHLSNDEIQSVVKQLGKYKYVILTEHLPVGEFVPNKDIISGQGIRIKKKSGVDLLAAPFHLKAKEVTELLTIDLKEDKGVIKTIFFEMM